MLDIALERSAAQLRAHGVIPPAGWRAILERTLRRPLTELSVAEPDDLIQAYFLSMDGKWDDVTTLVFLEAVSELFTQHAAALKPSFVRLRKNQFMTRIVLGRRLASRYFHEGRRRVDRPDTRDSGAWLLRRSFDVTASIIDRDERAQPPTLRTMTSQMATSAAHVARTMPRDDPARIDLLRAGLTRSAQAEEYGDVTADHDGYALELALRLHEVTGEPLRPGTRAAAVRLSDQHNSSAQTLLGDVAHADAVVAMGSGDPVGMVTQLREAISRYDNAIALPHHERSADIGYQLSKRGRSHALLYERATDADGGRDTFHLDRALADWGDPRTIPHRTSAELARLLLARARLATARADTTAARQDVEAAAQLLVGGDTDDQTRERLSAQELADTLESALDDRDLDAVLAGIAKARALPVAAAVPAGSLVKAVVWSRNDLAAESWRELAEAVLDRIEVDIAHPSLTLTARGHVRGHAATLARAIHLPASSPAGMERALHLSREHLVAGVTVSAAAYDGASKAAAAVAALRSPTTEAADEDQLGLWHDTLLWGVSALTAQSRTRTTVRERFDIPACAARVVDAADHLLDLTGDTTYFDSAADAVALAETLTSVDAIAPTRNRLSRQPAPPAPSPTRDRSRRASLPAGPAQQFRHAPASPVYDAWRALSDADAATGPAAAQRRRQAAELFASLADSTDRTLGGKARGGDRGVATASDPYGLTRQIVVLKRVDHATARREHGALTSLSDWLSAAEPPATWTAPDPLGVVQVSPSDSVLVMRRLPGHTLAHHLFEHLDDRTPDPQRYFAAAVEALADFHTALPAAQRPAEDVAGTFARAAAQLTQNREAAEPNGRFTKLLTDAPAVTKKDAHAGNWLWSAAAGGLILLDVEGSTTRPALLELATLTDDLPLLGLDPAGWSTRMAWAEAYLHRLPEDSRVDPSEVRSRLEAALLHVAVIGSARTRRGGPGTSSRGLRFRSYQSAHYGHVIAHLAADATDPSVRNTAADLLH
ncbi:hypothetical protein [Microbacterium sp. NPDC056569]|uniref:hypothetical protein n=1 Tax=Microbacterium sp. NPDC056569 TaxID=3345867 RepID=UPI00366E1BB4